MTERIQRRGRLKRDIGAGLRGISDGLQFAQRDSQYPPVFRVRTAVFTLILKSIWYKQTGIDVMDSTISTSSLNSFAFMQRYAWLMYSLLPNAQQRAQPKYRKQQMHTSEAYMATATLE